MAITVDAALEWSNVIERVGYDGTGDYWKAIGWTATETFTIERFKLAIAKIGSPSGNITVEIWDDDSGSPGTLITNGTSNTVAASSITTPDATVLNHQTVEFTWSTAPTLTSSNVYYFVIKHSWTTSTSNYITLGRKGGSATTGFTAWRIDDDSSENSFTSAFWCMIQKAGTPTYPQFEGWGPLESDGGASCAPRFPMDLDDGDVLVAIVGDADDDSFTTPTDWHRYADFTTDTAYSSAAFWLQADGTETGTVTFTSALAVGLVVGGMMFRFSNCRTDEFAPFECGDLVQWDMVSDHSKPIRYSSSFHEFASEWVAEATRDVDSIELFLQKFGLVFGEVWVEIWDESGGEPNAVITNGTSAVVDPSTIDSTTGEWVTFTFSTNPTLTGGNTYFFFIRGDWTPSTSSYVRAYSASNSRFDFDMWMQDDVGDWTEEETAYSFLIRVHEVAISNGVNQGSPISSSAIETYDTNRLLAWFTGIEDNLTTSTPVTYDEVAECVTAVGSDLGFALHTLEKATAGNQSAGTATLWGNDKWCSFTMAFVPPGGVTVHNLTIQEALHGHAADAPTYSVLNKLAIQEASHAHVADNLDLTYINHLLINDCDHFHTADPCNAAVSYLLVIQDALHSHAADNLDLGYIHFLSVDECVHDHFADPCSVAGVFTLEVQEALHDHSAENLDLSLLRTLEIQDALHDHAADAVPISMIYQLVIEDALHDHAAENLDLIVDFYLQIQDAQHSHLADNLSLNIITDLTVEDCLHSHAADPCNVAVSYLLAIDDAHHSHTADNVVLTYIAIIPAIADCLHAHSAEVPSLTAVYNLNIQEATHQHLADQCNVLLSYTLAIDECLHDHAADNLTLTTNLAIEIQSCLHAHSADNLDLVVDFYLVIQDCDHQHLADNPDLQLLTNLSIDDCLHAHSADNLDLLSLYVLSIDECLHAHSVDNLTIQNVYQLSVAECAHGHAVDNLVLTSLINLDPADCWHNHLADQCNVTIVVGIGELEIQSCRHLHYADDILDLVVLKTLEIADCLHAHAAEAPYIEVNAKTTAYGTAQSDESGPNEVFEMALLDLKTWFGNDIATDSMTDPSETDTAEHETDAFIRILNITLPSAGVITLDVRKTGANELTLEIASTGLMRLLENGAARITGLGGSEIGDGGQAALTIDGAIAQLVGDGAEIGGYQSLGIISGTTAEVTSLGTGGALGSVEFIPRNFPRVPKEL